MGKKWPHTRTSIFERLNVTPSDIHKRYEENVAKMNRESWGCLAAAIALFLTTIGAVCYTAYKTASLFAPHNS